MINHCNSEFSYSINLFCLTPQSHCLSQSAFSVHLVSRIEAPCVQKLDFTVYCIPVPRTVPVLRYMQHEYEKEMSEDRLRNHLVKFIYLSVISQVLYILRQLTKKTRELFLAFREHAMILNRNTFLL